MISLPLKRYSGTDETHHRVDEERLEMPRYGIGSRFHVC